MPNPKFSAARRRSWVTRKERYGASGTSGPGRRSQAQARERRVRESRETSEKSNQFNGGEVPGVVAA